MADENTKGILLAQTEGFSYDQDAPEEFYDEFYVVSSLYYSPETDKYYTNEVRYDFDIDDEGQYVPSETPKSSYVINLTKSQALEILDRKPDKTTDSRDITEIVNHLRNEVKNSTEILLASTSGQYRDPDDGDYIDTETSLYYSKGTDEYYTERRESYLYGGTPLSREVTALTKDKALSFFDECAKDNSGYNGIEMAPDEWVPASTVVNNEEVAGIIDNLRNEVNGVHNDTGSSATTMPARDVEPTQTSNPKEKSGWNDYAHIKMHAAFIHPYSFEKNGKVINKAYVTLPSGTKLNGIDIGNCTADVYLSDRMQKDMMETKHAVLSFAKDKPVDIWRGRKGSSDCQYYKVKATELTHAIKVRQEAYKSGKAQERHQERLGDTYKRTSRSSSGLYESRTDAPQQRNNPGMEHAE